MIWFLAVALAILTLDLIPLLQQKRRREVVVYLCLAALAVAGGVCYFALFSTM